MAEATSTEQIEERVKEALVSFGADPDLITRDADFETLDVDSLDLVELAQLIETEYGVVLSDAELGDLKTVGQAIDKVAARAGSS
jgi:acyl carrier protein